MTGNTIFAGRIKKLREEKGLSTTELAKSLDIQKSRVSMWETNGTVPRQDMLLKLCKFFNVTTDFLLGNDDLNAQNPRNEKIYSIQRALSNMDDSDLEKAQNLLLAVFKDKFGI